MHDAINDAMNDGDEMNDAMNDGDEMNGNLNANAADRYAQTLFNRSLAIIGTVFYSVTNPHTRIPSVAFT